MVNFYHRYTLTIAKSFKWECEEKHKFTMTYANVKSGKWCADCSMTISERTCKKIFEFI